MRVHTIGFSGKSAERFFKLLSKAAVQKLIDVRRSNNTLYAGFTRARDLPYLLKELCHIDYVHEPEFAPSLELLRDYQARLKRNKKDPAAWSTLVGRFTAELQTRDVVRLFEQHAAGLDNVCLLCMEQTADRCHRRLLAEYVAEHGGRDLEIVHL